MYIFKNGHAIVPKLEENKVVFIGDFALTDLGEHEIILLAEVTDSNKPSTFYAIHGPPRENDIELFNYFVAVGKEGEEMKQYPVKHGHRHFPGGFVETKNGHNIWFGRGDKRVDGIPLEMIHLIR